MGFWDNIPRGIEIDKDTESNMIIKTQKRGLVFSDYLGLFFIIWGFGLTIFGLIHEGFSDFFVFFSIAMSIALLLILTSLILSFKEYYVITITDKSIEIFKKQIVFSNKLIIDKTTIAKIDLKEIKSPDINMILNFRLLCNFGFYKIPRIISNNQETLIFQNYNKEIRVWIVDYLNDLIKNK